MPLDKDVDLNELARRTEGYTGADIAAVCREAAMSALRDNINADKIPARHFFQALEKVKPSLNDEQKRFYKKVREEMSSR